MCFRWFAMQLLQSLLAVLTLPIHQRVLVHGESSILSSLQAVLTANNELLSTFVNYDVYDGPSSNPNRSAIKFLNTFSDLSKFTASAFSTAPLLNFFSSSHKEEDLTLKAIREMISKMDSALAEGSNLATRMDDVWTHFGSKCGADEMNIKTSSKVFSDFMEKVPTAKTIVEKSKLAGRFTGFYAQTQMDTSVANLYKYITSERLNTVCDASANNVYLLGHYSYYLSSLMVLGLQMKVYYYTLTDTRGAAARAEEAMTQLSDVYITMQNVLINCLESFMSGVSSYISMQTDKSDTAQKEYLDSKYNWCDWTVTVVKEGDKPPTDFVKKLKVGPSHWVYLQCALRHHLQPCTEELCPSQSGHCRNVKALGGYICQCAKTFYGPKCRRSIQDDIDQSLLGQGENPIIVPDLTTIYYSIMDLKALLRKSN